MRGFTELRSRLSRIESDVEVANALRDFFEVFCEVGSAYRFPFSETPDKRNFLITFKNSADIVKATSEYNLRSFGFNGVIVEVGR